MMHNFNIYIAKEYDIDTAILLNNFYFWIEKNKANNRHLYENKYWTYNSYKAFTDIFPYWSPKQIRTRLDNLEKNGLIIKGNFNKINYDRTTWYSLTEKAYALIGQSNCPNGQMEVPERANRNDQTGAPIPDNIPDNKPNNKPDTLSGTLTKNKKDSIIKYWNKLELQNLRSLNENTERYKSLKARIDEYSYEEVLEAIDQIKNSKFLQGNNDRNWTITFDWLVKPNNFLKVLEGNFRDKEIKNGDDGLKTGDKENTNESDDEYFEQFEGLY